MRIKLFDNKRRDARLNSLKFFGMCQRKNDIPINAKIMLEKRNKNIESEPTSRPYIYHEIIVLYKMGLGMFLISRV